MFGNWKDTPSPAKNPEIKEKYIKEGEAFLLSDLWISISTNLNLKKHMQTHSGEIAHSCQVCGLAFLQQSNLKVHMQIHSTEEPVSC